MSMRQHNTTNFISVGFHICEVRNDNVNTRHVHIRECQSAVQDKHIIATFENGHILSDFIQTAQRNNPNRCPFAFPLIGTAARRIAVSGFLFSAIFLSRCLSSSILPNRLSVISLMRCPLFLFCSNSPNTIFLFYQRSLLSVSRQFL